MFVLSQVLAVVSTLLVISCSTFRVGRKIVLISSLVSNFLTSLHYICLQDYAGGVCTVICVFIMLIYNFKNVEWIGKFYTPLFFVLILSIATFYTWQDIWSLIPLVGHIILALAFWQDSESVIKAFVALVLGMWVVYNINLGSIVNAIGQGVAMLFTLSYFVRLFIINKSKQKKGV